MKAGSTIRAIATNQVLQEIIKTEVSYCGNIAYLKRKLEAHPEVLEDNETLTKVLASLENMTLLSEVISNNLQKAMNSELSAEQRESLRVQRLEILKTVYPIYSEFQDLYAKFASHIKVYPELYETLENDIHDNHPGKHGLSDLMIMPVQRVPRYKMLVQELLEKAKKSADFDEFNHEEFETLVQQMDKLGECFKGKCLWDPAIDRELAAEKEEQERYHFGDITLGGLGWLSSSLYGAWFTAESDTPAEVVISEPLKLKRAKEDAAADAEIAEFVEIEPKSDSDEEDYGKIDFGSFSL